MMKLKSRPKNCKRNWPAWAKLKGGPSISAWCPSLIGPVIKVIDAETKQVIRQIPSEEILQMNKRLQEMGAASGAMVPASPGCCSTVGIGFLTR